MNFFKRYILRDEVDDSSGGGIETPGDNSLSTAAEIAEGIAKNVNAMRERSEKDREKFGKDTKETQAMAQKAYGEVEALTKRLDGLETAASRPTISDIAGVNLKQKREIVEEVVSKGANYSYLEEEMQWKGNPDDYAGHTVPPFAKAFEDMTDEQKKICIAHNHLYWKYMRKGKEGLHSGEQAFVMNHKASLISDDTNAGYMLAPNTVIGGMLANVREFSPVRSVADVRSGTAQAIEQVRRLTEIVGVWVGETGTRTETTGATHGLEKISAHEHYIQLHASRQMLADPGFNLEAYFAELAGPAFGILEGTAYISGDGVTKPEGILTDTTIENFPSATAATIAVDDVRSIPYELKEPYLADAQWMWNRANVALLMLLQDGSGRYVWSPSLVAGQPAVLDGYPMRQATDLAATELTGDIVALFGSFRRAYRIYDKMGMTVLRDPYSSKNTGLIEFDFYRSTGGKIVLPEAICEYELS